MRERLAKAKRRREVIRDIEYWDVKRHKSEQAWIEDYADWLLQQAERVAELEEIKEKAHEWAAGYPLGGGMDKHAARDIYEACEQLQETEDG